MTDDEIIKQEEEDADKFREDVKKKFKEEIEGICLEDGEPQKDDGTGIKELKDFSTVEWGQALVKWYCEHFEKIDEDILYETISVGGSNDKGTDYFTIEKEEELTQIFWGQGKFSICLEKSPDASEIKKFFETIEILEGNVLAPNANKELQQCISKYHATVFDENRERKPNVIQKMVFVSAGPKPKDSTDAENAWKNGIEKYTNEMINGKPNPDYKKGLTIEFVDIEKLLEEIRTPKTPPLVLKFTDKMNKKDNETGQTSQIGFITAEHITEKTKKFKQTIFNLNPRLELGTKSLTFGPITETLSSDGTSNPKNQWNRFWKWNNGITAVCQKITPMSNTNWFKVDNMKIVNGRQTTYAFEEFIDQGRLSNVEVTIFLHEVEGDVSGPEGIKISVATNTQNPINIQDSISNSEIMHKLEFECNVRYKNTNNEPEFYFERQRIKWRDLPEKVRKSIAQGRRFLEKEQTWRCVIAFHNGAKEALGGFTSMIGHDVSNFTKYYLGKDIDDVIIPHIFFKIIEAYERKLIGKSETDSDYRDKKIIHKKIVKNNLLRTISISLDTIPEADKIKIKEKIIKDFRNLTSSAKIDDKYFNVIKVTYETFFRKFDDNRGTTWPTEVNEEFDKDPDSLLKNSGVINQTSDVNGDPTYGLDDDTIMDQLKYDQAKGIENTVKIHIKKDRLEGKDPIGDALKAIIATPTTVTFAAGKEIDSKDESNEENNSNSQ